MGKLVLAFLFFLLSAGFAVREAVRPPSAPAPPPARARDRADVGGGPRAPDRVNAVGSPDPARFAKPFYIRPLPPPSAPPRPPVIDEEPPLEEAYDRPVIRLDIID